MPVPNLPKGIQASCRAITYADVPADAKGLLRKTKCEVRSGSNYDFGTAVHLNGDGSPEYEFSCREARRGPCSAVIIGKVGTKWKDLTAKEGVLGFQGCATSWLSCSLSTALSRCLSAG